MEYNIKIELDKNPYYRSYLRSNSYWYKILTRNPSAIEDLKKKAKEQYKLRTSDKINDVIEKIDMISKLINVLR